MRHRAAREEKSQKDSEIIKAAENEAFESDTEKKVKVKDTAGEAVELDKHVNAEEVMLTMKDSALTDHGATDVGDHTIENKNSVITVVAEEVKSTDADVTVESTEVVDKEITEDENVEKEAKLVRPALETVYATAVFGKTFVSKITDTEIAALHRILGTKEHLNRNIVSLNLGQVQSYRQQDGTYEHLLQIMIHVNTASLWESSRSYIFHHLGRDIWNLRDGTEISLKRIHQKT